MVRSRDGGKTWKIVRIADASKFGVNETELVSFSSGRIVALMRSGGDWRICTTSSDDGGVTWQPVERTPMRGLPIRALRLNSGNMLCVYAYRETPGGVRACISYDQGQTWDIDNEIILRNDAIPTHWISPAGPLTVQLKDGSIFSAYSVARVDQFKPNDKATHTDFCVHRERFHCYAVASRYTEDYVRPVPWKKK